jgi:hypothetical protein
VVVEEDASGMDAEDLRRVFYMHAENEARRRGRTVRGVFGTGKAAAFGIGSSLQVETVRNGLKWVVRLEKTELQAAVRDRRKPLPTVIEDGTPTRAANGTVIIIDGVTKPADERRIIKELERRLGRHLQAHNVVVFNRRAELAEPMAQRTWTFAASDKPAIAEIIGIDVVCTINAAQTSVDDELRGVIVTAHDFPVAQILGSGDYAARLFGHASVPALESDTSIPGPYSDSRDLTLNEDNTIAGPLAGWLRNCLAEAASDLATADRELRRQAQDAALRNAASRMEAVLNRHFHGEFHKPRNPIGDLGTKITGLDAGENGDLVYPGNGFAGYDIPPTPPHPESERDAQQDTNELTDQEPTTETKPSTATSPQLRDRDPFGEGRGQPIGQNEEPRRRRAGGFSIAFEHAGQAAPRSRYLESELLIVVNLEHPELAAAYKDGDSSLFRMLAFDAAAQEYSYATAYLRIDEDPSIDASDIVEYVRSTMDSLTRDVAEVVSDLTAMDLVPIAPLAATV